MSGTREELLALADEIEDQSEPVMHDLVLTKAERDLIVSALRASSLPMTETKGVREALSPFVEFANIPHMNGMPDNTQITDQWHNPSTMKVTVLTLGHCRKAVAALRAQPQTEEMPIPKGMKPIYVKRWRTFILVPASLADEIRDTLKIALASHPAAPERGEAVTRSDGGTHD